MNDSDDELWALYAKGVEKLGEKTETPKVKTKTASRQKRKEAEQAEVPLAWKQGDLSAPDSREPSKPSSCRRGGEGAKKQEIKPAVFHREPLDVRIERNLSLGDVMIEAKLDLHGLSESAAHEKLLAFIETQHERGRRMLLVITGRGREGASVLRQNMPRWCDVPPLFTAVLAVRAAAPHHGGEGAYYVLLRKKPA